MSSSGISSVGSNHHHHIEEEVHTPPSSPKALKTPNAPKKIHSQRSLSPQRELRMIHLFRQVRDDINNA